jgi:N-acetylglucosaminyldiphosphoundecaprenol N-acetyl-beta-D-mannosaminyltransferase
LAQPGAEDTKGSKKVNRRRRIDVLGVGVSETNPADALAAVESWVRAGSREYVCVAPVSSVMAAQRDPEVMRALNGASLTVPDGMPLVWAGRYAKATAIERVYGPDLMEAVCAKAADRGWSSYLYGGEPGVPDLLSERLRERFPGLKVAAAHSPPFRPLRADERTEVAEAIDRSGADLVWVGLSSPKQDLWMADMVGRLERPAVLIGVGAAFDILAGLKQRPPAWMGPLGLFWLYRLLQEPRRLGRRYLIDVPAFIGAVAGRRPALRTIEPRGSAPAAGETSA